MKDGLHRTRALQTQLALEPVQIKVESLTQYLAAAHREHDDQWQPHWPAGGRQAEQIAGMCANQDRFLHHAILADEYLHQVKGNVRQRLKQACIKGGYGVAAM